MFVIYTSMNGFRRSMAGLLLAALVLSAMPLLAQQAALAPAEAGPEVKGSDLRQLGFHLTRKGHFEEALQAFRKSLQRDPQDQASTEAVRLLTAFLANKAEHDAQRDKEYRQAVQRVWRSLKAMQYQPKLEESGLLEPLREKVEKGVGEAQGGATTAVALERADLDRLQAIRKETTQALDKAVEGLQAARKMLEGDTSEYAREFRQLAQRYLKTNQAYRDAWSQVKAQDRSGLKEQAEKLKEPEESLSDALADLETLVNEDTWRIALAQAQLAKMIAPEEIEVTDEAWFSSVVAEAARIGQQAEKDARWYDALTAYAGLKELNSDSEPYQEMEKRARTHVRMLRLYGVEDDTPEEDRDRWREQVAGIDAGMVRDTIEQIGRAYVEPVDYRKLILGALESVKVLAETPQVAKTFPGLADADKRRKFLSELDTIRGHYRRKTNPSSLDLKLALNSVLGKSDQTVAIPTQVVAKEFADGALGELDRFSSMIWPTEYADFRKSIMGRFGGVGIQISKEPGQALRVVTPLPESPAIEAGIKAGDLIIAVEGKDTKDHDIDKLVKMISGPKGTRVTLTIKRAGVLKPFDLPVVRDEIRIRTVKGWRRANQSGDWTYRVDLKNKIGYIRVEQFTGETHRDLVNALKQLKDQGVGDLVLDLRFNPGGLLDSAEQVSNEFLVGGKIVTTKGRQQPADVRRADASGRFLSGNVVVLINDVSASAAEIVSGALKDWKRAVVVGRRSYGKGSVQNVIPIRFNKSMLKLTTAYYYLPTGRLLHRQNGKEDYGVAPDVPMHMTPKQTRQWLAIRSETDLIVDSNEKLDQQLDEQYEADLQLQTAVVLLKLGRIENGEGSYRAAVRDGGEDK
jgi:carboxyl-terminal processing protease